VAVFLGLDDGDRDVRLVVQDVVGALLLAACMQLATNDDTALGEADFLANLGVEIPASCCDGWCNELGADVTFGEFFYLSYGWVP
jgi:hypothetical protein